VKRRLSAEGVETVVRIIWVLLVLLIAWATVPRVNPGKVKVENLRGAAKYQALEQLARQ
jgi:hypothetical protein